MKHTKCCLTAGVIALLLSNVASAVTYVNPASDTLFDLSLNTGSYAWQGASATLDSTTSMYSRTYTQSTAPDFLPVFVPPAPGVPGYSEVLKTTTTNTYLDTQNYQALNINYAASLAAPIEVPQTYLLTGQINKQTGAALYSGGNTYVGFNMRMNVGFIDPYAPGSANGLLTFRLGSTPGNWTYQFQTTFNTSDGLTSLSNHQYLDLNAPIFYEAEYSIGGTSGVQFGLNNLSLLVYSTLNDSFVTTLTGTNTTTSVVPGTHIDYPALPVPEPETYAMMLAGLGFVSAAASRRKAARSKLNKTK